MFGENARTTPGLEPVYQRIFEREIARLGIENEFFPVGSAANYGLMYVLLRASCELAPQFILELGAGQTSLLLDRLRRQKVMNATVMTVEHDASWAASVGQRVSHRVHTLDLIPCSDNGLHYAGYDFANLTVEQPIDMLVIDGPPAGERDRKYSRHGSMSLLGLLNPRGFVVIVDDAERPGEALLCRRIDEHLRMTRTEFSRGHVTASKRQEIFAGGSLAVAASF